MPTVTYNPFISKTGFKSEGFEVDAAGNLIANNIDSQEIITNSIDASIIKLNGVTLFGSDGSSAATAFEITGDFIVSEGSTPYLSIINGQLTISNRSDSVGKIDNVDIGTIIPAIGKFTSVNAPVLEEAVEIDIRIDNISVGKIDEDGISDTAINNTAIGNITPNSATFTNASVNNPPLLPSHATRKDYVDTRISAFSIAFGI